jgi:hypothetical protein
MFLKGLMAAGLGSNRTSVDLEAAICGLEADAQMFAQYFVHFMDDAAEILHTFLTALVDTSERARVEYRLGIALRGLDAIEPRNDLRQFLVG